MFAFSTLRGHSFSLTPYRLPEQPLPRFQGIWRHPRYCKQTAHPEWTELESLSGLCLWLCLQGIYLLSFGMERRPWESQFRFSLFVVETASSDFSTLLCEDCNVQFMRRPVSSLISNKGATPVQTCRHIQTLISGFMFGDFLSREDNEGTSNQLWIFIVHFFTSVCVCLLQLLWLSYLTLQIKQMTA